MSTQNKRSIVGDGANCEGKPAAWYNTITVEFYYEDAVNGTDEDNSLGVVPINFLVKEGEVATLHVTQFTVDDWGYLDIYPKGHKDNKLLHLGLEKDIDGAPGDRGGHVEWGKVGEVQLLPGEYVIEVSQTNATYNSNGNPRYNVSKCNLLISATAESACCIFAWPMSNVALGTPITWYECNTRRSDSIRRRWNTGTIYDVTPEQFMQMAKVVYAEAAREGIYTTDEMRGIASVMLNRMGRSKSMAYRSGATIIDITTEFAEKDNWKSVTGPLYKSIENTSAHELADNRACQKIIASINALLYVLQNGATVNYDRFVSAKTMNTNNPAAYEVIGGTAFLREIQYRDCRPKPAGWDELPIDKNGPLAQSTGAGDIVS